MSKGLELLNKHLSPEYFEQHLKHLSPYVMVDAKNLESILRQGFIPGHGDRGMAGNNRKEIENQLLERAGIKGDGQSPVFNHRPLYGAMLPSTNPGIFASDFLQAYGGNNPVALKLRDPILERSTLTLGDSPTRISTVTRANPDIARKMFRDVYPQNSQNPYLELQYWGNDKSPLIIESMQVLRPSYSQPNNLIELADKYGKQLVWDEIDFNTMRKNRRIR